jgi:DNA-3-methyladenine glycosylase I
MAVAVASGRVREPRGVSLDRRISGPAGDLLGRFARARARLGGFDPPMIALPSDGRARCWWPNGISGADPLMVEYHDREWGVPVETDRQLFERLALESFQAGLSWSTILHKREAFVRAFDGFDPAIVAAYGEEQRNRLLADPGIVRNRAKIDATVGNARALLAIRAESGSFAEFLRRRLPRRAPTVAAGFDRADLPATTAESDALSAELRKRGFKFVGSTIVYAFMQSVGLVDDHLPGCFLYRGGGPRQAERRTANPSPLS